MSYSDSSVVSNGQLNVVFKNCPALSQLKGFSFPPATVGVRHVPAGCELGGGSGGGAGPASGCAPPPRLRARSHGAGRALPPFLPFPGEALSRGFTASGSVPAGSVLRGSGPCTHAAEGGMLHAAELLSPQEVGRGEHAQPAQPGSRLPPAAGICTFVRKVVGWFLKSS